jgi:hypothetical protein
MLRFFSAGVFLLTIASSVSAGERYVEIWNPPEARVGAVTGKCAPKIRGATASTHSAGKVVPRRIADPLSRSASGTSNTSSKRAPVSVVKKPAIPPSLYIPRVITPEGNVLRV